MSMEAGTPVVLVMRFPRAERVQGVGQRSSGTNGDTPSFRWRFDRPGQRRRGH